MLMLSILLTTPLFVPPADEGELWSSLALTYVEMWDQDPIEEEEEVEEEIVEEEVIEEVVEEEEVIEEEIELTPEEATELLETALKSRELDLILVAIEDAGRIADKNVVKQLGKAIKHKEAVVRMDALTALRFNESPEAFKVLVKLKKYKPIIEDPACAEAYYMALGQKADIKALPILTDKLHITERGDKATRARIVAIGRIRDPKSVEALMDMLVSGSARRRHPNIKEIHLCLTVLTGADVKSSGDAWQEWWNENKKGLKVSKEEQEATTKRARATWKTLWADPEDAELMKEALKRGKTDFADADEDELKRLRELAEKRKKKEEGGDEKDDASGTEGGDTGDGSKDDGEDF